MKINQIVQYLKLLNPYVFQTNFQAQKIQNTKKILKRKNYPVSSTNFLGMSRLSIEETKKIQKKI